MQRFKNILVFTDAGPSSKVVLERSAALAKRNGAQLTALSVLESLPRESQRLFGAVHPADLWEWAVVERQQKLDRSVAGSWDNNPNFTTKVLSGSPSIEVIKEVLRRNHDIVLMAAEGESGVKDVLFGCTPTHLMRECPCPVWVMKSAQCTRDGRVMAAVDPMTTDPGHESLNHRSCSSPPR
jgi:nucleotide-binding universal stress UspA family protein